MNALTALSVPTGGPRESLETSRLRGLAADGSVNVRPLRSSHFLVPRSGAQWIVEPSAQVGCVESASENAQYSGPLPIEKPVGASEYLCRRRPFASAPHWRLRRLSWTSCAPNLADRC